MKIIHQSNHNSLTRAALLCLAVLTTWLLTACTQPTASEPPAVSDPKISAPTPQEPGQEVGISVDVSSASGASLTYAWRVDGGDIVRGQGSPAITYRTPDEPGIYNVRVAVMWDDSSVEKITTIRVEAPATPSAHEPPTDTPTPEPTDAPPTATGPPPTSTLEPTATLVPATATPVPTNTPRPTPVPTATIDADPTVYDNFNNPAFDGEYHPGLWEYASYTNASDTPVEQGNGILSLSRQEPDVGHLEAKIYDDNPIGEIGFFEGKVMLDSNIQTSSGDVGIHVSIGPIDGEWLWFDCVIGHYGSGAGTAQCNSSEELDNGFSVPFETWHKMRMEIHPDSAMLLFFIDDQQVDSYTFSSPNALRNASITPKLKAWSDDGGLITGYFDDVRIGQLGQ